MNRADATLQEFSKIFIMVGSCRSHCRPSADVFEYLRLDAVNLEETDREKLSTLVRLGFEKKL